MTNITNLTNVETQIVTLLAAESVTAYAYESPLLDRVPLCTFSITPPHGQIEFAVVDQAYGIKAVTYSLRYYVDLSEASDDAFTTLKTGVVAIVNALGADRRLGNKVRDSELGEGRVELVAMNQRPELMFEAPLRVVLHPNVGE